MKRLQEVTSGMQFESARLHKVQEMDLTSNAKSLSEMNFENCFTCGRNLWPMRRNPNHKNLSLHVCDRLPFKCENRTIKIRVEHKNYLSVCDFMQ